MKKNNWFIRHPGFSAFCLCFAWLVVVMVLQARLKSAYLTGAEPDSVKLLSYFAGLAIGSVIPLWVPFLHRIFSSRPQVYLDEVSGRGDRFCVSLWIILSRGEFLFFSMVIINQFFTTQLKIPIAQKAEPKFGEAYNLLYHSLGGFWNGIIVGSLVLTVLYRVIRYTSAELTPSQSPPSVSTVQL